MLTVDFVGKVDGVPFPGGAGHRHAGRARRRGFIPGFTERHGGHDAGRERQIDVTFPEDYHAKDLAGKAATFDITAKALKHGDAAAAR